MGKAGLEWGVQDTIVKFFKKTRLYPQEVEEDDDSFEGEDELPACKS